MLMRKLFTLSILLTALAALVSCSSGDTDTDPNPPASTSPIVRNDFEADITSSRAGLSRTLQFNAADSWTAASTDRTILEIAEGTAGSKGLSRIKISVSENNTGAPRTASIIITVNGYDPLTLVTVTQNSADAHPDYQVNNQKIDPILSEYYLWNTEYINLNRNYAQAYDDFVEKTLLSMSTNDGDGGRYSDGSRYLYSYITRTPSGRSVLSKEAVDSFGIINLQVLRFSNVNDAYGFAILGVYPDSPASRAGIVRGDIIAQWNGANITSTNFADVFYTLVLPSAGDKASFKLNVENAQTITLTAESIYANPVLHSEVIEMAGSKIGYVVYSDFEASFDDELLEVLRGFKSQGIDDIIVDLRINGGGHVISAQMLSSIIAGDRATGKACIKYLYNGNRMQTGGWSYPDKLPTTNFGPASNTSDYSTGDYLSLSRAYFIVSDLTASASELTFTALRGIDFPVTLIGSTTEGKNVGMEPQYFDFGGYSYEFLPITFMYLNAKNETCDSNGTVPDYEVDDWDPSSGYADWNDRNDPCVAKALELITGQSVLRTRAASDNGVTRMGSLPHPRSGRLIAPRTIEQ